MKNLLTKLFLFTIIINCTIYSQTNVSGLISINTTWDKSGNPFIVTSNLVIDNGATLNISPGVEIRFRSSTKIRILDKATLIARGTSFEPITFVPDTIGIFMDGIYFEDGATSSSTTSDTTYIGGSVLEYCIFKNFNLTSNLIVLSGYAYPAGAGPSLLLRNCTFFSNKFKSSVYCHYNSSLTIVNSDFNSNSSLGSGGAVSSFGGTVKIYNTIFRKNTSAGSGGAYYSSNDVNAKFIGCTFLGNKAVSGGAIAYWYGANYLLSGNQFIDNIAQNDGAAIYDAWADTYAWDNLVMVGNYFTGNLSNDVNGAVVSSNISGYGEPSRYNAFFSNNTKYSLKLHKTDGPKNLSLNYWGVTDSMSIRKSIFDFYMDPGFTLDKAVFIPYLVVPIKSIPGSATLVASIATKSDSTFSINAPNEIAPSGKIYLELLGIDSSPWSKGLEAVRAINNSSHDTLDIVLVESSDSSGLYRATIKTGSITNKSQNIIQSLDGQSITLISLKDTSRAVKVLVGAQLVTTKSVLDFGKVANDDSLMLQLVIRAGSSTNLIINSFHLNSTCFTLITSATPFIINGYNSLTFFIKYKPSSFNMFIDTLTITSDGGIAKIILYGSSPYPVLVSNSSALSFGAVARNSSKPLGIKISNTSINTLTVDSIYTKTKQFVANKIIGTVALNETLSVMVDFKADTFAVYTDTLYLRNNSVNGLVKIPLKGESPIPVLTLLPNVYRKDSVAVGDSSSQVFVIKNTSVNDLSFDSVKTKTLPYIIKGATFGLLKSNDSTLLTILFKPNVFGEYVDTLLVSSLGKITKMPLAGSSPYPKMVMSLSSLDFGNVRKDTASKKTIVVKNTSINKLRIDSLKTKSTQFTVDKLSSPVFITKKDSAVFIVTFKADTIKKYNDTLSIFSNQNTPVVFVALTGSGTLTSVLSSDDLMPKQYELNQNYPNPFNPSTTIRFGIPNESNVRLEIYNLLGQLVETLVNEMLSANFYEVKWEAGDSPTGLYFYKIIAIDINNPNNKLIQTKKMMLVK